MIYQFSFNTNSRQVFVSLSWTLLRPINYLGQKHVLPKNLYGYKKDRNALEISNFGKNAPNFSASLFNNETTGKFSKNGKRREVTRARHKFFAVMKEKAYFVMPRTCAGDGRGTRCWVRGISRVTFLGYVDVSAPKCAKF